MASLNDHKQKLMIMLMGKKKPPMDDAPDEEPSMGGEGLHAAMEDFLAAVKADDPAAMAEAWRHAEDCGDMPEE